ncbi:MAG TPA: peptide-methionine (S)-S-oxide reductase MsrA [Candidatus Bathyarchaeia archaeon]|nr:peptide-methionine (S)-S-oxide reductase MsrA [Candidatus Bathyarchaeia archaeon]
MENKYDIAVFAGGCFWCLEPAFDKVKGVKETIVGYTGGHVVNPSYEQVCEGGTGHAEAIQVIYDPKEVSYQELLKVFWTKIDPTAAYGQFSDVGNQYRTGIFYSNEEQYRLAEESKHALNSSGEYEEPIVTTIEPATVFYPAEEYHQDYYRKNPVRYNAYYMGSGRGTFCPVNVGAILNQRHQSD